MDIGQIKSKNAIVTVAKMQACRLWFLYLYQTCLNTFVYINPYEW